MEPTQKAISRRLTMTMQTIRCPLGAILVLVWHEFDGAGSCGRRAASKPTKQKKAVEPQKPRSRSDLSKPLSNIRTNILDMEREGYFAIAGVDFRTRGTATKPSSGPCA